MPFLAYSCYFHFPETLWQCHFLCLTDYLSVVGETQAASDIDSQVLRLCLQQAPEGFPCEVLK